MLAEAVNYLDKTYFGRDEWEILVVDDGSADRTLEVVLEWAAELQEAGAFDDGQVRVCKLERNRGKGGAVSHVLPTSIHVCLCFDSCAYTLFLIFRECNIHEAGT